MSRHQTMSISLLSLVVTSLISVSQVLAEGTTHVQIFTDSSEHLIDAVPLAEHDLINAVIEISAGSLEKWEVDSQDGYLKQDLEGSTPRIIDFLPYPANYGFIPQTIQDPTANGDGDPLDVIVLSSSMGRGAIVPVEIIGAIKMMDSGEVDDKYIAVVAHSGPFSGIKNLSELTEKYPGSLEIIRLWFEYYKHGSMHFVGYVNSDLAMASVLKAHETWNMQLKNKFLIELRPSD